MPIAPIVVQNDSLARGIEGATNILAKVMERKADRAYEKEKTQKGGAILQSVMGQLSENPTIQEIHGAKNLAIALGAPIEQVNSSLELFKPYLQQQAKTNQSMAMYNKMFPEENLIESQPSMNGPQPSETQRLMMQQEGSLAGQLSPEEQMQQQPKKSPIQTINESKQFSQMKTQGNPSPSAMSKLSDDQLVKMQMVPDKGIQKAGEVELKRRELAQNKFERDRTYHTKISDEAVAGANKTRQDLQLKESALNLSRQAIETGDVGPISWNNLAKHVGLNELTDVSGAQLNQAGKEFFFGNMSKVSAKGQNQWMEKLVKSLAPEIGDQKLAALTKQTMLEGELELSKIYLDEFDRLVNEDTKEVGFPKRDIESRALQASYEKGKDILNKTAFKTRSLYEQDKGRKWMEQNYSKKPPKGTYLTPNMLQIAIKQANGSIPKALENAKKTGYLIPTPSEIEVWNQ